MLDHAQLFEYATSLRCHMNTLCCRTGQTAQTRCQNKCPETGLSEDCQLDRTFQLDLLRSPFWNASFTMSSSFHSTSGKRNETRVPLPGSLSSLMDHW